MDIQATKKAIRLREWSAQINDCIESHQPVSIWCKERGINVKTYYNRLRRVREEHMASDGSAGIYALSLRPGTAVDTAVPQTARYKPSFVRIPIPQNNPPTITVRIGDHTAEICNGADDVTLTNVLSVLARI